MQAYLRNLLSDFDSLVERALVAQTEGRQGTAMLMVDEAVRVARHVLYPCVGEVEPRLALLKRRLATAVAELGDGHLEDSQRQAENAKRYLRRELGPEGLHVGYSHSGKPIW